MRRTNFGQIALERRFAKERQEALLRARSLGHEIFWVEDDLTEGAIGCDDCGLWGRVIIQPLADHGKNPDEIAGAILDTACSIGAVSKVHGDAALRMRQFSDTINLPAMFADVGHEPKEVRNEDLIPQSTRYKKGRTWSFNGRRKGGES